MLLLDQLFDQPNVDVASLAIVPLQTSTEEIEVLAAPPERSLHDHAGVSAIVMTSTAPQLTFQVVVIVTWSLKTDPPI